MGVHIRCTELAAVVGLEETLMCCRKIGNVELAKLCACCSVSRKTKGRPT